MPESGSRKLQKKKVMAGMVYKICFVSTHGTGKTALAALTEGELKRRGTEAKYLNEMATEASERGLPINEGTTLEAQLWILHRQFAEELTYTRKRKTPPNYQVIICDRGPDNYCYLEHHFGENKHALDLTLGHLTQFPYSQVYLLPIVDEALPAGAGVRTVDHNFQQTMDKEIRGFLQRYNIEHQELPRPAKEDDFRNEWLKVIVNKTLEDLGKPKKYFIK